MRDLIKGLIGIAVVVVVARVIYEVVDDVIAA